VARENDVLVVSKLHRNYIWTRSDEWNLRITYHVMSFGVLDVDPLGKLFATRSPVAVGLRRTSDGAVEVLFDDYALFSPSSTAFSRSGRLLAIGGSTDHPGTGRIVVLDRESKKKIVDANCDQSCIRWMQITDSEDYLVAVDEASSVTLWQLKDPVRSIKFATNLDITGGVDFADADQFVVFGTKTGLKAYKLNDLIASRISFEDSADDDRTWSVEELQAIARHCLSVGQSSEEVSQTLEARGMKPKHVSGSGGRGVSTWGSRTISGPELVLVFKKQSVSGSVLTEWRVDP
jgi:hypothetical protein